MERRNKYTVVWSSEKLGIENYEDGLMSHFLPDEAVYRAQDSWGNTGWIIGYREWVPSAIEGSRVKGFGGQVLFLEDGPERTVFGIDKSKIRKT